jgi:hypothetical protein
MRDLAKKETKHYRSILTQKAPFSPKKKTLFFFLSPRNKLIQFTIRGQGTARRKDGC